MILAGQQLHLGMATDPDVRHRGDGEEGVLQRIRQDLELSRAHRDRRSPVDSEHTALGRDVQGCDRCRGCRDDPRDPLQAGPVLCGLCVEHGVPGGIDLDRKNRLPVHGVGLRESGVLRHHVRVVPGRGVRGFDGFRHHALRIRDGAVRDA